MKLALRKDPGTGVPVHRAADANDRPAFATNGESGHLVIRSRSGTVLHTAPQTVVSALRYTVAGLQLEDKNGVPGRLGVTAALSGEGVSYVARSLAAVLAHDGEQSVCLVDLNWWSAGGHAAPGVADIVRGTADLRHLLMPTDNPRLMLLPAGAVAEEERAGLAKSTALQSFLDDLSMRFHHLVIDLPALLVASESITLAGYTDACTLVVRHGVTPVPAVQRALKHLGTVRLLGVVLNRASSAIPSAFLRRLPAS